jgi:hypothetical protein
MLATIALRTEPARSAVSTVRTPSWLPSLCGLEVTVPGDQQELSPQLAAKLGTTAG